jgi:regulator of protease activity HflC (stomatin/prohibitin superfamily)
MPIVPPPPGDYEQPPRVIELKPPQVPLFVVIALGVLALLVLGVGYWWFVQRVEVQAGEVLVLMRRMGATLPATDENGDLQPEHLRDQVVLYPELLAQLPERSYKGVLYEPLPEGRYFYDPFLWKRMKFDAVVINQDEAGVLVRKYGAALPPEKIIASEPTERGPLAGVKMPERYNINPLAYEVKRVPRVEIPAGHVGVTTRLHGDEPANPNTWVVETGERGVQPDVRPPGRYYLNPYEERVSIIDIRSHTLDFRGEDAIRFPSKDSFEIILEATVEYAIRQDKAPYVMVAIGEHSDIEEKLILPYARSLARIEGSKLLAREFITGETRESFQDSVFNGLREECGRQGIEIRATLIRRIEPPAEIANPISDRQIADQQIKQFESEIQVAESQARLVEQEELQKQNRAIGEAQRDVVSVVKTAEQDKEVALTEARKRLEVARLQLEAAREEAAAIISRGEAEAEVILLNARAEAEPLASAIAAFGDGESYAQFFFYRKLGPALKSILADTEGPFADIFRSLSAARGGPISPRPAPPDRSAALTDTDATTEEVR